MHILSCAHADGIHSSLRTLQKAICSHLQLLQQTWLDLGLALGQQTWLDLGLALGQQRLRLRRRQPLPITL
jgi:hypothetical protein